MSLPGPYLKAILKVARRAADTGRGPLTPGDVAALTDAIDEREELIEALAVVEAHSRGESVCLQALDNARELRAKVSK